MQAFRLGIRTTVSCKRLLMWHNKKSVGSRVEEEENTAT